jgi:hypothetical protein
MSQMLAKQEIYDCLMRYTRGIDRCDKEALLSAFHADAVVEQRQQRSVAAFAAGLDNRDPKRTFVHFIGNVVIELFGDAALAESYFVSYHDYTEDGVHYLRMRGGRYIDRFAERGGHWKIAYRVVVDDWAKVDPVSEGLPTDHMARPSALYPDDPVYKARQRLLADLGIEAG